MRLLFLLLLSSLVYAQVTQKEVQGVIVLDNEGSKSNIVVKITSTNAKDYTLNRIGESFKIQIEKNDTLHFVSNRTKERKLFINDRLWNKNKIVVHLEPNIVELDDLALSNFKITGYLKEDLEQITYIDSSAMILNGIGFKDWETPTATAALEQPTDGNIVPNGVSLLSIGLESAKTKRHNRNLEKYENEQKKYSRILNYYGSTFFTDELGLELKEHRAFMVYLYKNKKFTELVKENNYLKLEVYMADKVRHFKKLSKGNHESKLPTKS